MKETFLILSSILSRHERRRVVLVFILMVLVALSEVAGVASLLPFISVISNDNAVEENEFLGNLYQISGIDDRDTFILFLGGLFLLIVILSLLMKAVSTWAQIRFQKLRVYSIGARLLQRYLGQSYVWYLNQHTSRLVANVLSEINAIVGGSIFPAMQLVSHFIVVLALFTLLIFIEPLVAILTALSLGLAYSSIYFIFRRPLLSHGKKRYSANRERYRVVNEVFGGIKDVKVKGLEKNMLFRFRKPAYETAIEEAFIDTIKQLPGLVMQGFLFIGIVIILLYLQASHGSFSDAIPSFTTFAYAGYRLMPSMQQLYRNLSTLRSSRPALEALVNGMNELENIPLDDNDTSERINLTSGYMELKNLEFSYPGADTQALKSVDIHIPAYSKIGIAGTTGSGKTTLVDIMLGLLAPDNGSIVIDGIYVDKSNIRKWQKSLGYVPQHIFLADETIARNIAFGIPDNKIDMDAVRLAARTANLDDFIMNELPHGYDTFVGEKGVRLSGGQRQRIGIARAIYYDPNVLIMDEATSALDNITEDAVMKAVNNLGDQKTIIMIAHRLSTLFDCDIIYFLEYGKVVAKGSFDELIKTNHKFREMAEKAT